MRPQFAREQVSDLNLEGTHVQNLMRALNLSLTSGNWIESVDLGVLFIRLTLDSATEFLFGISVDSQLDVFPSHGCYIAKPGLLTLLSLRLRLMDDRTQWPHELASIDSAGFSRRTAS